MSGIFRTFQLSFSATLLFLYAQNALGCENTRFGFFGSTACNSNFSGFNNLYGQNNPPSVRTPGIPNSNPQHSNLPNSNWIVKTINTSNAAKPTIYVATKSKNGKLSRDGPDIPAKMLIRCMNNTTAVLFEFPGYEMSDVREFSEIVYHTGGESDDILELSMAADKSILGVWKGFRSIPFVRKLFNKQNLNILATAKNGVDITAEFDISGIENSITKLRNSCEW